jgi:hypothetical protein
MSELLPGLLVLAIGGSVAPPMLLPTILFLGSRRPLPNATALALGYLYYLHGYRYLATRSLGRCGGCRFHRRQGHQRNGRGLLIVLGLRSLLKGPDPDASPPGWMECIDSMSPPRAFGIGVALFPLQDLPCIRSVLPCQRPIGAVRAWDIVGDLQRGHRSEAWPKLRRFENP